MSDETTNTPPVAEKRKVGWPKGKPRGPRNAAKAAPVAESTATAPPPVVMTNTVTGDLSPDEMLQYGGDIAAWDSIPKDQRHRMKKHTDAIPGTMGFMPNLNAPGMLVYRPDPSMRFHFKLYDEDGSAYSRLAFAKLQHGRCRPATKEEFQVHPDLQWLVVPDATGRLTFAASKTCVTVVMYQGEADYRREQALLTRQSDDIQRSADERSAERNDQYAREGLGGLRTSVTLEDDFAAAQHFNR